MWVNACVAIGRWLYFMLPLQPPFFSGFIFSCPNWTKPQYEPQVYCLHSLIGQWNPSLKLVPSVIEVSWEGNIFLQEPKTYKNVAKLAQKQVL